MTNKEIEILKTLYKAPKTFKEICKSLTLSENSLNIILSSREMDELIYTANGESGNLYTDPILLNHMGKTIVENELERRKTLRINQCTPIIAVIISVASFIVSIISLLIS